MNSIQASIVALASGLPLTAFEERISKNGKGKPYLTTRTVNVQQQIPVPGKPGYVGRAMITFCVNVFDIMTAEQAKERGIEQEANEKDLLSQLLAKYGNPEAHEQLDEVNA